MAVSERTAKFLEKMMHFGVDPRTELGDLETGFRHQTYYHKYFHGYTEIRHTTEKGRIAIERVYTAPWHRHRLETWQWLLVKIAYILGALLSSGLFLWAMVQRIPTNGLKIVAAPGFVTGFLLLLTWAGICAYVTAPRKMTWWEFRSGKTKITRFALWSTIAMGLTVITKLVLCAFLGFSGEFPSMAALCGAAVPLVLMFLAESKMPYEELENENQVTDEERYEIL